MRWELTGDGIAQQITEKALGDALERLPEGAAHWVGVFRAGRGLYLSRRGDVFDVVLQDDADRTWRVWAGEPQPTRGGVRAERAR